MLWIGIPLTLPWYPVIMEAYKNGKILVLNLKSLSAKIKMQRSDGIFPWLFLFSGASW
jgi:hypothetical protein